MRKTSTEFEKILCGLFVSRFSDQERLQNKIFIIEFMRKSINNADFIAKLVIKLLGSAKYNLHEFKDVELGDLLGFLSDDSQVKCIRFSHQIKSGITTLRQWQVGNVYH